MRHWYRARKYKLAIKRLCGRDSASTLRHLSSIGELELGASMTFRKTALISSAASFARLVDLTEREARHTGKEDRQTDGTTLVLLLIKTSISFSHEVHVTDLGLVPRRRIHILNARLIIALSGCIGPFVRGFIVIATKSHHVFQLIPKKSL